MKTCATRATCLGRTAAATVAVAGTLLSWACGAGDVERRTAPEGAVDDSAAGRVREPGTAQLRAPGHWAVAGRAGGLAILARLPDRGGAAAPAARGRPPTAPAATRVLLYPAAGPPRYAAAEVISLVLAGVPPELSRPLAVGRIQVAGRAVHFSLPGSSPALLASPGDPGVAVFEEANALWSLAESGEVRRLTAERVDGFDYHLLAARQREGAVILYWAASPVWSPGGQRIAYATNREAVAERGQGQSIWLLEMATGEERALVREPGGSFRPFGWLGEEVLYIGSDPGVWAVHAGTGARRRLAEGVEVDAAEDGTAVAVAEGVPEATVLRILAEGDAPVTVPPAPAGFTYAAQAAFSPDGRRLLLQASAEAGTVRRFFVYDLRSRRLEPLELDAGSVADWPVWLDERTLLLNQNDPATSEPVAAALRVP